MEAPDAKRPRLDHEPAPYPPSGHPLRPASTSVIPSPQHSHADHPLPAPPVHSYTAPPSAPGPSAHHSAHHPPVPPSGQPPRENGADPHRANTYPATSHSVPPPDHQPGYGVGPAQHHLPYPTSTQPGSAAPPAGYDSRRTSSSVERHPSSMAEHQQHHGLPQHPPGQPYQSQVDPHVNGNLPSNGLPYHAPDQYAVGPVAHHSGYPPTPSSAYHAGPMYAQGPSQYVGQPRRKQVRATQACNQCRQRKQKCDEQRPCGYCSNEGLGDQCQYKEVQPPKADRNISQLLEQQNSIVSEMQQLRQIQENIQQMLQQGHTRGLDLGQSKLTSPPEYTAGAGNRYTSIGGAGSNEDVKNIDTSSEVEEQVPDQAPTSHHTGAQHLFQWPYIVDYFKNAGITSAEYVVEETERSGTLRPYGFSHIENGQILDAAQDEGWDEYTKEQIVEDPLEDMWGNGLSTRGLNQPPNIGGGNPDGSLDLVQDTVWRLYDSYMRNMWVLHPFLDAKWLNAKIEEFVNNHSPHFVQQTHSEGHFAVPGMPASGGRPGTPGSTIGKRKRQSNASEDGADYSPQENHRRWQAPKKTPDRSMQNAIILLVLALGKVLMEERFLLEEFSTKTGSADPSESSYANSPYDASKPSPRSHTGYENASSPGDIKAAAMARAASYEGHKPRRPRKNGRVPNTELFPGLAYFAHASDILGNNLGGNSIMHGQAFLLAGIYYGQLGRVTESWSWINEGLRVTTILSNKKQYQKLLLSRDAETSKQPRPEELDPQATLISILCWSALQLESDLRAELDQLPQPTQLMYSEAKIILPPKLVGVDDRVQLYYEPSLNVEDILHSYHYQIHLRLTLNRTHTALYSTQSRLPHNRKKRTTVAWTDADHGVLFHVLQNTRKTLGNATKFWWQDSTDLATSLLAARIRAKYYGGEYIILRPYIYSALRWQNDGNMPPRPPFDLLEWVNKHNEAEKEAAARRAFNKANGLEYDFGDKKLPEVAISYDTFQSNPKLAELFLWCCKRCIDAAMASTSVFDGVASPIEDKRLRVTNIHGTATAQFSNMLVLCAVTRSWLSVMVDKDRLKALMDRTIALHDRLSPLAPIFRTNRRVLAAAAADLYSTDQMASRNHAAWQASPSGSYHGSHPSMSPASAGTPRATYGPPPPGPTSAHSSFSSVRYS